MTDDEAALLAAVRADPDANLPRLVYADWLEENGRPDRAEFIRVQCELARNFPDEAGVAHLSTRRSDKQAYCDRFNALRQRADAILTAAGGFLGEWPDGFSVRVRKGIVSSLNVFRDYGVCHRCGEVEYARGFVGRVECTAADWLAHGDEILARHPVRVVRLTTRPAVAWFSNRDAILADRWPGVEFELPGVSTEEFNRAAGRVLENLVRGEFTRLPDPPG